MQLLFVTIPEASAQEVVKAVLDERLAAGVSILPHVTSRYWWKGRIEEASEAILLLRTSGQLVMKLVERIRQLHPYKVPEIQLIEVSTKNPDYLKWLQEVTQLTGEAPLEIPVEVAQKTRRIETVVDVLKMAAETPLKVVVVGAPGAGSRTLGYRIAHRLRWKYYSPIEQHLRAGGSDRQIADYLDAGQLIPDEVILRDAEPALQRLAGGGVVAGFPMTRPQAELLKKVWGSPTVVFMLNISPEEVQKRLAARLSCLCGRTYGPALAPHKAGVCDTCGQSLFRRKDDQSAAAVRERFRIWTNVTKPAVLTSFAHALHPLEAGKGYEHVMKEASTGLMKMLMDREAKPR